MIKATFYIDITNKINGVDMGNFTADTSLNYKEQTYNLNVNPTEQYQVTIRPVIDRAYNSPYNSYKDYYKTLIFKYDGQCIPVYPSIDLKALALSVGGKDNLELGKIVAMHYFYEDREGVVFFVYE